MPVSLRTETLETSSNNLFEAWFPRIGLSLDWAGIVCGIQLQPKGIKIGLDQAKKSKIERWAYLPRTSFSLQIQRMKISGRTAPFFETLLNLKEETRKGGSFQTLMLRQLDEIQSAEQLWTKLNKNRLKDIKKPQITA